MDYMVFNSEGDMISQFDKEDLNPLIIELYAKLGYNIIDLKTGNLVDFKNILNKFNSCE